MPPSDPSKRKRVRNPELHRAAILDAARAVFSEMGYAKATIREIARRAGVTHGLVVLHYSTKEQLFVSAILDARDVGRHLHGTAEDLPERIARSYVEQIEALGSSDPFVALIRSAGDTDVARRLLQAMRMEPADEFLSVLDVPDLDRRADLLFALLVGVTFGRYVLADGPLAAMTADELTEYLVPSIRLILQG